MTKLQEDILRLHGEGKSYNQIVEELKCSKGTVSYYCGHNQKLKAVDRQRDNRGKFRKYIQEYKSGKTCMDCSHEFPYFILQFDHRPGEKKLFNISKVSAARTLDRLKAEIDKCDLVCANCHAMRTWQRLVSSGGAINWEEELNMLR
jgi:hypothetical protein